MAATRKAAPRAPAGSQKGAARPFATAEKKTQPVKAKVMKAQATAKAAKALPVKEKAVKAKATKALPVKEKAVKAQAVKAKPVKAKAAAAKGRGPEPQPAPKVGSRAPSFALPSDDGSEVTLDSLRGKNVVLYFYPRDMTPGCTVEACGFRDHYDALEEKNAVVLGVSRDSVATHAKFKAKENLPFPLLSDPNGEVIAAYGSWGEKTFMGRKSMGILRTTVIIDGEGKVRKVYPKVSTKDHATQVLRDLEALED